MTTTLSEQQTEKEPDAVEINALLAKLRITRAAVERKDWLAPGLADAPPADMSMLSSTTKPVSALDSAGMGFFSPMVSFLDEPLDQLRGDPSAVTSGAGEFDSAATDATAVADEYKSTVGTETSEWSGEAASGYGQSGMQLIDGILTLAETSLTASKSLIGAGEVVAQAVGEVTRLSGEAVGKIMPIMDAAIAAAPSTFGHSLAVAIPQCVQIAVDYAGQIAGKLGALLTSGENLMKLIDGALGVVQIAKGVMKFIGDQSQNGGGTQQQQPQQQQEQPEQSTQDQEEEQEQSV